MTKEQLEQAKQLAIKINTIEKTLTQIDNEYVFNIVLNKFEAAASKPALEAKLIELKKELTDL